MTSKRLFYTLCIVLVILAGASIAGVVYGNKFLEKETHDIVNLKVESLALDEQQRSLIQAKKDIEKYSELELISKSIVPQEKDQARTVREIIKIANENNVNISNITFPASSLGAVQAKPATPAPEAATGTTPTPAKPAQPAAPQTTQVKPVDGIPGVYQLEVTVQSGKSVLYSSMLNFLSELQQNRRTSHITKLEVTPDKSNSNRVTFNLVINAYIKP